MIYLGYRWFSGTSTPSLSLPTPSTGSSNNGGPIQIGTATPEDLPTLLATSSTARAIYNFQALLYSFGYTSAAPDGVMGPVTQGLIAQVNQITGNGSSSAWTSDILQRAHLAMLVTYGANAQPLRNVPTTLPASVIAQLNADALAADPNAVLIQATSS